MPRISHRAERFSRCIFAIRSGTALALILFLGLSLLSVPAARAADSILTSTGAPPDSTVLDSLAASRDTLPAWSAGTEAPRFDFSEHKAAPAGGWVWVISSILIVIGLLYLFLYLLRRYFYRPGSALAGGGQFQLLQQFHLGPKKHLTLIKVCGRVLLLGVTDTSISTLLEISDEAELKRILEGLEPSAGPKVQNFRDIYQGLIGRRKS